MERIKPVDVSVTIGNESGKTVPFVVSVDLILQIRTSQARGTFIVAKKLAIEVILGWDYCDLKVETIEPRHRHVEKETGSIVPIARQPRGRQTKLKLLEDEEDKQMTGKGRPSPKIQFTKRIAIQPDTQTWVEVVTKQNGP